MSETAGSGRPRGLPRALRITEQPMRASAPADPMQSLAHAAQLYLTAPSAPAAAAADAPTSVAVELAVEVWRLERRIRQARDTLDERTRRGLESSAKRLAEALERMDVAWRDETGAVYSDGMRSVRALAFEDAGHLAPGERRILETVRPAVLVAGEVAAAGEVIVGVGKSAPDDVDGEKEGADASDD